MNASAKIVIALNVFINPVQSTTMRIASVWYVNVEIVNVRELEIPLE